MCAAPGNVPGPSAPQADTAVTNRLAEVSKPEDIFPQYVGTPIAKLLEYHNLERELDPHSQAELLIGMCMDSRKHLRIPDNFAFILRAGGANLRPSEFKVSYAVAVGGARAIALLGHTQCGMVNLMARKDAFIQGLVDAGWEQGTAEDHFYHYWSTFEIGNEEDFVLAEAKRLRLRYPKIPVAPMIYRVEDNRLYQLRED
jgi:carbonic anhydrase